jgi:prolyl-tRNA synthetase
VPIADVPARAREMLEQIQRSLFEEASGYLKSHTFAPKDRTEFIRLLTERAGMIEIPWCERPECEAQIKAETSATSRNLRPLDGAAACGACGEPARVRAYFAQAY